jgi:hypothetical protein
VEILGRTTGAGEAGSAGRGQWRRYSGDAAWPPGAGRLSRPQVRARLVCPSHPDHPQAPSLVRQYVRSRRSPRGAQALILGGEAAALLEGVTTSFR